MDRELSCASTGWDSLGNAANVVDWDHTLDLLLVDVEDGVISDGNHTLLRPLELVDLLDQRGVNKGV